MTPLWRQAFDSFEKAVAPGLEDLAASPEFRDAAATMAKLNAAGRRQAEQVTRQVLHSMNLPTASDIRKLRRQISQLDQEVATLRRALENTTGQPASPGRQAKLAAIDDAIAAAQNGQTAKAAS